MNDIFFRILVLFTTIVSLFYLYERWKSNVKNQTSEIKEEKKDQTKTSVKVNPNTTNQVVDKRSEQPLKRVDLGFLKIYKSKVPNVKKSLDRKVPVSEFIHLIKDKGRKEFLMNKAYTNMWDFGVNASKIIKPGDTIWILTGNDLYETKLELIIPDETGEIGDTIGWSRQYKRPWKNVAVFKCCRKVSSIPEWVFEYSTGNKRSVAKNFYKVA